MKICRFAAPAAYFSILSIPDYDPVFQNMNHKSYVDVDDIIYAGVNDDRICPNYN